MKTNVHLQNRRFLCATARGFLVPFVVAMLLQARTHAEDWPQFRGADQSGHTSEVVPIVWSETQNLLWKRDLPGFGGSSAVTANGKVFVACYSGYGDGSASTDVQSLKRQVVALDEATGEILWTMEAPEKGSDFPYQGFMALHGYASNTPATDGERVYAFFGTAGVYALDANNGDILWRTSVGDGIDKWGSASSVVLHNNLVIVNAAVESGAIVALDKQSGAEKWRLNGIRRAWSTPVLVQTPEGATELVMSMEGSLLGMDPNTGEKLWECAGIEDYVCPSVAVKDGVVFALGGRRNDAVAVKTGGRGDVTETHTVWRVKAGSNVPSPVIVGDHAYWANQKGEVFCLALTDGSIVFQERLPGSGGRSDVYASTIASGENLIVLGREGVTHVISAKPVFELLKTNKLSDGGIFNGTPSISNGKLLLRSDKAIYCIAEPKGS